MGLMEGEMEDKGQTQMGGEDTNTHKRTWTNIQLETKTRPCVKVSVVTEVRHTEPETALELPWNNPETVLEQP